MNETGFCCRLLKQFHGGEEPFWWYGYLGGEHHLRWCEARESGGVALVGPAHDLQAIHQYSAAQATANHIFSQ